MKHNPLLFLYLLFTTGISYAAEIPVLGDGKAESHQVCGKSIDVQIRKLSDNFLLIGLVNNKTQSRDLFRSQEPVSVDLKYTKFIPVHFDNLSKNFIEEEKPEIEIVWGSAMNDKKEANYTLALGPEVYDCGLLQKWPHEAANILYGEAK
ncbi:hypothetical protein FND52_19345 [Atlantibacter subterranea]|uniref:hypothetical protein n=1 Tax=Atlantibacter subterraneus TaxID=255519 RepID=UPI001183CD9C|nr:hypothetical protein [Atlantibacter subterranea]TSJ50765.1 hypothetical protein FND52_19345 [Atlantibacter subterranea]